MGDEDIDALLEAPFDETRGKSKSSNPDKKNNDSAEKRKRSRSRDRDRKKRSKSRSRERKRRSTRSRERERDREREQRRREREREREREPRRRSPPDWRNRGGGGGGSFGGRAPGPERRDVMPFYPRCSPPRGAKRMEDLTPEERDMRTIFILQLAARTRPEDLEDFFSAVGKVRDVRIITDSKTKRSKGIAYVEFYDVEAVALALGLNGTRLLGAPLMIQPTQAEKNRAASMTIASSFGTAKAVPFISTARGPMKVYVGSLHFNVTDEMLRSIFEPFGKINSIQLLTDPETGISRGYGFITYADAEDARKSIDQMNGFELAGRPMKVSYTQDHQPMGSKSSGIDTDDADRPGIDLGTSGRLQLMAKLAEGSGMRLPDHAQAMLNPNASTADAPPIATQCFMLSNMFDPATETAPNWDVEVADDVIEECNKHGGVLHIFVDKASAQGNVYVKCTSITSAVASVTALHGRWFAGKIITANYVPVPNYHSLFPDAINARAPLNCSSG